MQESKAPRFLRYSKEFRAPVSKVVYDGITMGLKDSQFGAHTTWRSGVLMTGSIILVTSHLEGPYVQLVRL